MSKSRVVSALCACGAAFGIVGGLAASASATTLVDLGDTTYDSSTHLEWLDLTFTANHSRDEVDAGYGGYTTGGWRFATIAELTRLFNDAGGGGTYPQAEDTFVASDTYTLAISLLLLLGENTVELTATTQVLSSQGWLADTYSPGLAYFGEIRATYDNGEYNADLFTDLGPYFTNRTNEQTGSFLVRGTPVAATPIPGALPLLLTALGGLGFVGWRRRVVA